MFLLYAPFAVLFIAAAVLWTFEEKVYSGFLWVLLFVSAVLLFFFEISVFAFLFANPILSLGAFVAYFIAGGIWTTIWTWPEHVDKKLKEYSATVGKLKSDYEKSTKELSLTDYVKKHMTQINVSKQKFNITMMITFWIFDFLWVVIHKPVTIMKDFIYDVFANAFNKITDRKLNKALEEDV